jgi:hypothetical protein
MLTAAVAASLLAAVLVELRHRRCLADVASDPFTARPRRTQFLLETWAITSPGLLLLALSGPTLS